MKRFFWAALGLSVVLASCATQLPPPTSTFDNVRAVQASAIGPLALGAFAPAPSLPAGHDTGLGTRAETLKPPNGNSFSAYLRQTIEAELAGAGKLDPNATRVLSGELTRSDVSTTGAQSRGILGARFRLTVARATVFDKEIVVEDSWPSAFLGIVAITDAQNHYTDLYPRLFAALLEDSEFRAVAR